MYFTALASLGLQTLGIIEIAKNKNSQQDSVNTIISLRIVLSVIAYLLLFITVILYKTTFEMKKMILISGTLILATSFYVDWIFNALQIMEYISYSVIIKNMISSFGVIIIVYTGIYSQIYIVPIMMSLGTFISGLYLLKTYFKKSKLKFHFIFHISKYKNLIANSWPFFFSGIFATINSTIATLMLGFMKSSFEVGLYNSVYKIVNVIVIFVSFIFTPIYPLLIEYFNQNRVMELENIMNGARKLIYIISIPLIFVSFTINKEIMLTLYGSEYIGATLVFTILMSYVAILYLREIYGYQLTAWNMQKKYMKIVLISSSINVITNLLFIPRFGIVVAAINTLVSELINLVLMHRVSRTVMKLRYDNSYILKVFFSAMIMAVSLVISKRISTNAFILSGIGAAVYFSFICITKTVTISELKVAILSKERQK